MNPGERLDGSSRTRLLASGAWLLLEPKAPLERLIDTTLWTCGPGDGPFPTKALVFAICVIIAGMAIEPLQDVATTNRRAEVEDVVAEVAGALGALGIHAWLRQRWSSAR